VAGADERLDSRAAVATGPGRREPGGIKITNRNAGDSGVGVDGGVALASSVTAVLADRISKVSSAVATSVATRAGLPARWSVASQKSRTGAAEAGGVVIGSSTISANSTLCRKASGCWLLTATARRSVARTSKSSSLVSRGATRTQRRWRAREGPRWHRSNQKTAVRPAGQAGARRTLRDAGYRLRPVEVSPLGSGALGPVALSTWQPCAVALLQTTPASSGFSDDSLRSQR
jgi:hypothetical protein